MSLKPKKITRKGTKITLEWPLPPWAAILVVLLVSSFIFYQLYEYLANYFGN